MHSFFVVYRLDDGDVVRYSHLEDTTVDDDCLIGPYFRSRSGTHIRSGACIGNFVELKNVDFGEGGYCLHLSYMGDAEVGKDVNVGCGFAIANFDGVNIASSKIGDNVFLGSGSTIISPVNVGDGAFIAAGSTVNKDVPRDAMAIARVKQENKENYAPVLKEKASKKNK